MTYERGWRVCWAAVVALGVCWAALVLPLLVAVVVVVTSGAFVLLAGATIRVDATGGPARASARGTAGLVVWGGASSLACLGLLGSAGVLAVTLVALAAASSPPLVRRLGPRARGRSHVASLVRPPRGTDEGQAAGADRTLRALSDEALCRVWSDSYWFLGRVTTCGERTRIVALRGRVLDEMDRRRPSSVVRWLDEGPSPQLGPPAFRGEDCA